MSHTIAQSCHRYIVTGIFHSITFHFDIHSFDWKLWKSKDIYWYTAEPINKYHFGIWDSMQHLRSLYRCYQTSIQRCLFSLFIFAVLFSLVLYSANILNFLCITKHFFQHHSRVLFVHWRTAYFDILWYEVPTGCCISPPLFFGLFQT